MPPRQDRPLPAILLMTNERMGEALWPALHSLPHGAGVIFRHYTLPPAARRALYERVRVIARRRRLILILAGSPRQAIAWRADGAHGRSPHLITARRLLRSAPVHDAIELQAARRTDLRLVSPIYATRSHPGTRTLGRVRLGLMLGTERRCIVALGGMDAKRADALRPLGIVRWAAIDGLSPPVRT